MSHSKSKVSIEKQALRRLALIVPLVSTFLFLSYQMLFGPCTISLPGLKVTKDLDFRFFSSDGIPLLSGHFDFGHLRPDSIEYGQTVIDRMDYCATDNEYNTGCIEELHNQRIRITYEVADNMNCYHILREGLLCPGQEVKDCFDMHGAHWYGGFQSFRQPWPLEKMELPLSPYISADVGLHASKIGGVLERFFISTNGIGIYVQPDVPLHISLNPLGDHRLCLLARYDNGYYHSDNGSPPALNYTICHAANVQQIFLHMSGRFIPKPVDIPDPQLFTHPKWSTWAMFNKEITQQKVLDFALNITKFAFPSSQLEIDDKWTPTYGDLEFDKVKFPDPKDMVTQLNRLGFRVTLWTHPFMNLDSNAFQEAAKSHFVVSTIGNTNPALATWWNGKMAALLDVTNPAATLWYLQRLGALKNQYNISSFKFDAGEALFLPRASQTHSPMVTPAFYSNRWADLAYQADPYVRHQEVRAAWTSQSLPVFVRIFDRWTAWEAEAGGLETIIPMVLTLGILGYPFVLPDMIGGNAYSDSQSFTGGMYPDRELYLRWLEASALLPALQFSVPPWIYDEEVIRITKDYVQLHEKYAPTYLMLAHDAVKTGHPIIRPLWWVAPDDKVAQTIGSQFLLGNDLLVAPVLEQGARRRDIYIPEGTWHDVLREHDVTGPVWLRDYEALLHELPRFERM